MWVLRIVAASRRNFSLFDLFLATGELDFGGLLHTDPETSETSESRWFSKLASSERHSDDEVRGRNILASFKNLKFNTGRDRCG